MKILITGANGQLGLTLQDVFSDHDLILTDRDELDITDADAVDNFVETKKPDVVINAAAFTNVDQAEIDKDLAKKINLDGASNLAAAAKKVDAVFFHISTDFVFDGEKTTPYLETDEPNPLSIYGQTKFDSEKAVARIGGKYFILRTAWLYSPFGKNFVKTMAKLGREKDEIKVVSDQIGCPTYAFDLALAIKQLLNLVLNNETIEQLNNIPAFGLYHFAGDGECSWFEFATEIIKLTVGKAKVLAQTSEEYAKNRDGVTAKRPAHSTLNCDKIRALGVETPKWNDSLKKCIEILSKNKEI